MDAMDSSEKVKLCSTEADRTSIVNELGKAMDFINENDELEDISAFTVKLTELEAMSNDIFFRVSELQNRPEAVRNLTQSVESNFKLPSNFGQSC